VWPQKAATTVGWMGRAFPLLIWFWHESTRIWSLCRVEGPLHGKPFRSIRKDMSTEVTQAIWHIDNEDMLTGMQDSLKWWKAVKRQNGDYIAGLYICYTNLYSWNKSKISTTLENTYIISANTFMYTEEF
jgi:hypothetical protein